MKKVLSVMISLLFVLIASNGAFAKNFNLKFSTMSSKKDPWGQQVLRIAKAVEKNTNGSVKVTPYMSSKLGAELDVIKQVARGRIDMGGFALAGASSIIPELALLGTPFMFDSNQQYDCVLDNHLAPLFEEMFRKKGLKLIAYSETGTYSTFSTKPIRTPADVKSWKLRINQSKFSVLMWQSVGANPVPLPFSEFHAAIQTGMVNGGDLTPTFYVFMGFPKLAPYLTLTEHSRQPGFILMSLKAWNRFSSAQQKQFMDSQEPISGLRKQIRGLDTMMAAKYEKAGGPVHHLTPEELQQWLDAVVPQQQKIVDMVGGQSERVWAMIQDGKASCKK
ncbi:MAG: TRAP transporter substrate-binding protein [Deltaproteobacteria bacterium]|nr:TRAP transporter substrate-binding protein [Deltaproteobacteria bacterium]